MVLEIGNIICSHMASEIRNIGNIRKIQHWQYCYVQYMAYVILNTTKSNTMLQYVSVSAAI